MGRGAFELAKYYSEEQKRLNKQIRKASRKASKWASLWDVLQAGGSLVAPFVLSKLFGDPTNVLGKAAWKGIESFIGSYAPEALEALGIIKGKKEVTKVIPKSKRGQLLQGTREQAREDIKDVISTRERRARAKRVGGALQTAMFYGGTDLYNVLKSGKPMGNIFGGWDYGESTLGKYLDWRVARPPAKAAGIMPTSGGYIPPEEWGRLRR